MPAIHDNMTINASRRLIPALFGMSLTLFCACDTTEQHAEEEFGKEGKGVLILCEGNYNSGNSSLSYYDTETGQVENGVFLRANDRRLGDTGQSITVLDGAAYIAMENSGIIWKIDTRTFRVEGQLTAGETGHMTNPRHIHFVNREKAYVTDLYSPYITIMNPQTMQSTGSISTEQAAVNGYASTEEMVQIGHEVFAGCWSYSRKILVIDTDNDCVTDSIVLSSWQPKSLAADAKGKLWAITDGGYDMEGGSFGDNTPHLYRIDPASRQVELDLPMETDEATVRIALSPDRSMIYILNNDIYRMRVTDNALPSAPFLRAPVSSNGRRHKLYGIDTDPYSGDIYVADAVDYSQAGTVYRYDAAGNPIANFRVGITPNGFAFTDAAADIPDDNTPPGKDLHGLALADTVFEYMPAPGHQVNGYSLVGDFIHDGATMKEACDTAMSHMRKQWMISLGAQGGYIVAGFGEKVMNSFGDYDIAIKGNPFAYQSEPGIIWVSLDENGNGKPDDRWYELAGSEYGTENETTEYAITYYKPSAPKSDTKWTDNKGGEGIVPYMESWNSHDYYWQDWVPTEKSADGTEYRTYYGSRLKDTHTYENGFATLPAFGWGYADNYGEDYFRNRNVDSQLQLGYYKLCNAVCADGTPANLPYIDFVKIQTGQTGWTPNLGEISTEVYGIWRIVRQRD